MSQSGKPLLLVCERIKVCNLELASLMSSEGKSTITNKNFLDFFTATSGVRLRVVSNFARSHTTAAQIFLVHTIQGSRRCDYSGQRPHLHVPWSSTRAKTGRGCQNAIGNVSGFVFRPVKRCLGTSTRCWKVSRVIARTFSRLSSSRCPTCPRRPCRFVTRTMGCLPSHMPAFSVESVQRLHRFGSDGDGRSLCAHMPTQPRRWCAAVHRRRAPERRRQICH